MKYEPPSFGEGLNIGFYVGLSFGLFAGILFGMALATFLS